jgi:hypothetical protein
MSVRNMGHKKEREGDRGRKGEEERQRGRKRKDREMEI